MEKFVYLKMCNEIIGMRKNFFFFIPMLALMASCGGDGTQSAAGVDVPSEVKVAEQTIMMVNVEPSTFSMGFTPSGTKVKGATLHQVLLSGYSISKTPVSQALWESVMGSNPSSEINAEAPVDMVSYKDCGKFLSKLSKLAGIPFSLPTEAQWENAIVTGQIAAPGKYSVWCADSFVDDCGSLMVEDPMIKQDGSIKVKRTIASRAGDNDYVKAPVVTFYMVVNTMKPIPDAMRKMFVTKEIDRENVSSDETIKVGDVSFNMIGVGGGTFDMGGTKEQGKTAGDDEKPVHEVTLSGFEIAQTEVTAGLWLEVMGSLPYGNSDKELSKPVVNVSWYDCYEFIMELNKLTGRKFRLPTEAEWEFAARGGNRSKHTPVSGGTFTAGVAAYLDNSDSKVQNVKKFASNELGIYDMSGNAWEWCQDTYAPYSENAVENPYVNSDDKLRVMRGGSAASRWDACRVSNRSGIPPSSVKGTFGFRLAL